MSLVPIRRLCTASVLIVKKGLYGNRVLLNEVCEFFQCACYQFVAFLGVTVLGDWIKHYCAAPNVLDSPSCLRLANISLP